MKKLALLITALLMTFSLVLVNVESADAVQRVNGYTTKNGRYVAPYYRSSPNTTKFDNYSTRGNINPYTGSKGTVNPFKSKIKKYKF